MKNADFIHAKPKTLNLWEMDLKSYVLVRYNPKKKRIEVRIMKVLPEHKKGEFVENQKVLANYDGKTPEDVYYKIINDGWITKLQHAAYLGAELQKAYYAMKKGIEYVQDEELDL